MNKFCVIENLKYNIELHITIRNYKFIIWRQKKRLVKAKKTCLINIPK